MKLEKAGINEKNVFLTHFPIKMRKTFSSLIFPDLYNINYYEKTKRYNEETTHYYLENTGKI